MARELEDVIVIDRPKRRLLNFSDIIPKALKEEELTENLDALLHPGQDSFGIEYFDDEEESSIPTKIQEDGGSHRNIKLKYLLSLPLHRIKE